MLIYLKRTFVYFLIVNYLQLTLMPSFVFAMEKDEILQALPRLEPIKPFSAEEREGWEAPAVLSPAIASQALPVLTISLHRQENGSFRLQMQQTGAAVYSELLPKGKMAKDYQGHKIDLNLGDALTSQVVFTTINPACNYLFHLDGNLSLGGALETSGYFQVQKANSFSLPANLLAASGIFLDNIKTLTHEGTTTPRVIAKRGPIAIKKTGDDKPLEIKAVLEARTGIKIETDAGDLVIASDIKTPSTIVLKSKGNTSLKKTSLTGVGGIEITSAGTVAVGDDLASLLTNKLLGIKAKSISLQAGTCLGLEGIDLQTSSGNLKLGGNTKSPHFKTNGNIVLGSTGEIELLMSSFQAGKDIVAQSTNSNLYVGNNNTGSEFIANGEIKLLGHAVGLYNGKFMGIKSLTAEATTGQLQLGSETSEPIFHSDTFIKLIGKEKLHFVSGIYSSGHDITVDSPEIVGGVPKTGMYLNAYWQEIWAAQMALSSKKDEVPAYVKSKAAFDRHYIETKMLPAIRKVSSHPAYLTYESFIHTKGTSYKVGMDLNDYWQKVWVKHPTYAQQIKEKTSLVRYELPVYLMSKDQYDRHYIETKMLPELRKLTVHPGYKNYESFISESGTGYKVGMDPEDYWQTWVKHPAYAQQIKEKTSLVRYELPVYLMSKGQYERHYIESRLLPAIRKVSSHPAYLTYESFIHTKGTSYKVGMDLNDYWQKVWVKHPTYAQQIKEKTSLVRYELPAHLSKVAKFQANNLLTFKGNKVHLYNVDLIGLAGIAASATEDLTIGSNLHAPELLTKGDLTLTAGQQAHLNNGVFNAEKIIKVTAINNKLTLGNSSSACPQFIAGYTVDLTGVNLDLLMANLTAQKGITADATTGQLQAGTASTIPVLKSNTLINLKGKREIWMLNGVYTSLGDITLNSNNIILGQGSTSVELTSHNLLTCTGGNIHIFKANLKGVKGVKFNATSGYISIGKESIIPEIKTKGNIILIADQYINLVQGIFEAEEAITATSTNHTIDVGDNRSAPQLISGQHTSLVGNQVNVVNGSFSSKQNTILHAKKQAVNFGAGSAKLSFSGISPFSDFHFQVFPRFQTFIFRYFPVFRPSFSGISPFSDPHFQVFPRF